jgi:signal transduction histidine kinase/DNA-binding response OmpR family regulator
MHSLVVGKMRVPSWRPTSLTYVKSEVDQDMTCSNGKTEQPLTREQDALGRRRRREQSPQPTREAEVANLAKDQFLANISHELRTPMAAILGLTDLALRADLNVTVRGYLQTVRASADGLLQLLNQLLDLARLAAGQLTLESIPFQLRTILDETLQTLCLRAREKGLALIRDLPQDLPNRLVGDPLRLHQILANLVGNAIKFTAQGEVVVRVTQAAASPEDGGEAEDAAVVLHFAVSDTGIGISPEDQQRIFAPFAQADASTTRPFGGAGLGLAIASRLADLMGGRMWVDSEVGRGSTFHFTARFLRPADTRDAGHGHTLRKARPPERSAAEGAPRCARAVRSLRVLVVEDTVSNQKLALALLGERGHAVRIAVDGRAAVELVQQQDFDVVVMDLQMPVMDGFQATAAIRALADPTKARVPIVAMTAYTTDHDRERCLAAGMDAFVAKPVAGPELIELIEGLAHPSAAQPVPNPAATGPQAVLPAEPSDPAESTFSLEAALKQLGGREQLFREMVTYFETQAQDVLAAIRQAQDGRDAAAIARAAHALKGTLVYLGAAPAVAAAKRVEQLGRAGDLATAGSACRDLEQEVARLQLALGRYGL